MLSQQHPVTMRQAYRMLANKQMPKAQRLAIMQRLQACFTHGNVTAWAMQQCHMAHLPQGNRKQTQAYHQLIIAVRYYAKAHARGHC